MSRKWRHRHQENDKHRMEKPGLWRFLTSRLYGITFSLKMYRVKKIATAQGRMIGNVDAAGGHL